MFSGLYVLSGRLGSLLPALSEAAAENSQSGGNLADTRVAEWDKEERLPCIRFHACSARFSK